MVVDNVDELSGKKYSVYILSIEYKITYSVDD